MRPQISVIVPIYKVEKYLSTCIDSILDQSYNNLDIILVDDGSPDGCGEICDDYSKKDKRIRVIHQKNGGLSDARNTGIKIATGDYFYFVDSDDVLPRDSIEKMYELARKHNAEMIIGGFERFYDDGKVFFKTDSEEEYVSVMNKVEAMKDFYREGCRSWGVLYQRTIHEGVFFPVGEINEDEAIVFQLLNKCKKVVVTNKVVYSYRCREDSITTSCFSKKKLVWIQHCKENLEWIKKYYPELEQYALERYRGSLLWLLTEIILCDERFDAEIEYICNIIRQNKRVFLETPFKSKKEKLRFVIVCYFPIQVYKTILRMNRRVFK